VIVHGARRTLVGMVVAAAAISVLPLHRAAARAAGVAGAQVPESDRATGIELVHQDAWVAPSGAFVMLLRVDDPALAARPGAAISVRIYQRASTRTAFDSAIDHPESPGRPLHQELYPVASLPRLGGNLVVGFGLRGSDQLPRVGVGDPGAYPLEVSLTNTGAPTSSFLTWLVVAEPLEKPLLVSWVWQLVADPGTLPDGRVDPAVAAEMEPGGRLDRIATLLARSGNFPVSLLLGPETVETWARLGRDDPSLAAGFGRVRTAARRAGARLLPAPYVPVDATALEVAGLGDQLSRQVVEGGKTLEAVLGATPLDEPQTAFVEPVSDAVVDRLREMLVARVAVRADALNPVAHNRTPARSFSITTPIGRSDAVATAPFVERLLDGDDPPVLEAQRVVAALTEVAYESPGLDRGLLLAPPARWSPDVEAMVRLVEILRDFPLVRPVTLDRLFAGISDEPGTAGPDSVAERTIAPVSPPVMAVTAAEYAGALSRLRAFEGVVGAADPAVGAGGRALLRSLSAAGPPERARAELAAVETAVRSFTEAVRVDAKRVTLTARRAQVPLSFRNDVEPAREIRVRVHLESPKLVFPDGADHVVTLAPGTSTVQIEVEARTSGTFPMTITLSSEDGQLPFGAPARITVRSAAFGGIAVVLSVGAVVFLAAWWANHVRRNRRSRRRPVPAVT
jgi:hypothetical protein